MAAGIVYHNITTSTGVTFAIACWVPNTATPDVGVIPVSLPIKSDGTVGDITLIETYLSALGAKADAKSTATDTTAVSAISVLKQISASVQAPPSQAVTNAGTFAVQSAATIADGADVAIGAKADAAATATDTTPVSGISIWKQISKTIQAALGAGQTTKAASSSVTIASDQDPAHDAADAGNPIKLGGYAKAAAPADVNADGDRVNAWFLRNGAQTVAITAAGALVGATSNALDVNIKSGNPTSIAVTGMDKFTTGYYVSVAASQTDSVIQSSAGAAGDYLEGVLVIPATTAAGVVTIKDNATTLISYAGGGTTALLTLTPFFIPVGAVSRSGAWKVTTGANVSILAIGKFS